jgi:hypothetical protein
MIDTHDITTIEDPEAASFSVDWVSRLSNWLRDDLAPWLGEGDDR